VFFFRSTPKSGDALESLLRRVEGEAWTISLGGLGSVHEPSMKGCGAITELTGTEPEADAATHRASPHPTAPPLTEPGGLWLTCARLVLILR